MININITTQPCFFVNMAISNWQLSFLPQHMHASEDPPLQQNWQHIRASQFQVNLSSGIIWGEAWRCCIPPWLSDILPKVRKKCPRFCKCLRYLKYGFATFSNSSGYQKWTALSASGQWSVMMMEKIINSNLRLLLTSIIWYML